MCDRQIEQCLTNFQAKTEDSPPPRIGKRRKKPPGNEPDFDLQFYRLWTTRQAYCDPGMDYYEQQYRERIVKNLKKKARSMGFELVAQPEVTEGVS